MDIITVEAKQVVDQTIAMAKQYDTFTIANAKAYQLAGEDLKQIKATFKEVDSVRKSFTQPLDLSKKNIMARFKEPLDRLTKAEATVKYAMIGFQQEQDCIRREEEARLAEIQRKQAEELRLKAEKEAARIANLKTSAAREKAAAKAIELAKEAELVEAIVPVVESTKVEVKGIAIKKIWKFEVTDISKLPAEYLIADDKMIGQMVRGTQGRVPIAGVRIYSEDTISSRS